MRDVLKALKIMAALPRKLRIFFIVLGVLLIVSLAGFFGLRKTVTLRVDGSSRTLTTYAIRVSDLLAHQRIAVSPSDLLSPALGAWLKNGATVSLMRAVPVQLFADGRLTSLFSAERLPAKLLSQAGIKANPTDQLLSDGQAEQTERKPLIARVAASSVVLSTVGVGADVDRGLMQKLAESAHGRTYFTDTGMDLPDIFAISS